MAKPDVWTQAKLLFEMGKGVREISRKLDLPVSSLSRKSRDWKQGALEQPILAIAAASTELEQSVPPELLDVVAKEIEDRQVISKSITNLQRGALTLHGMILKKAIEQAQTGELSIKDTSQIVATMGLKVDQIHKMNNPESSQVNIQNNNTASVEPIVVNITPVAGRVPDEDEE